MPNLIRLIIDDYGWIHLAIGLAGNVFFFAGSILFLPVFEELQPFPIWLFVLGSGLMLIGAVGRLLVSLHEK